MDTFSTKITYIDDIKQKISYYLEDDQLRLIFIVILLIGIILLITGVKQAILFMLIGFGLLAFLCIFKPKPPLLEDFICEGFHDIISNVEDSRIDPEESEIGITKIQNQENRNNNFRNSSRYKK